MNLNSSNGQSENECDADNGDCMTQILYILGCFAKRFYNQLLALVSGVGGPIVGVVVVLVKS